MNKKIIKKVYYFLIVITLTNSSCSSLKYLDAYHSYNSKPHKVETSYYSIVYVDSAPKEQKKSTYVEYFDPQGKKYKQEVFNPDGTQRNGGATYEYDNHGNLTKELNYNVDGSLQYQLDNKYNRWGQRTEHTNTDPSRDRKTITKTSYNRKEKSAILDGKYDDGAFFDFVKIRYDNKWRRIEAISHDPYGNPKTIIRNIYDERGNETISNWYSPNNVLGSYYITTYNSENDKIRHQKFSLNIDGQMKIAFDETHQYKYDDKGNWTEKTAFMEGKKTVITRRSFKYKK